MTDILMRPLVRLQVKLAELREREDGQTTTEYAILLGFLAIAIPFYPGPASDWRTPALVLSSIGLVYASLLVSNNTERPLAYAVPALLPAALHNLAERIVAEWKDRCFRDGLDAWSRAQCLEHGAMRLATLGRVVAPQRRVDLRNRQLTDVEARSCGCTRGRATDEQSAQDQQCQRQRELRGDERAAHGDASGDLAADLAGLILERRQQVRPRQSQRGP